MFNHRRQDARSGSHRKHRLIWRGRLPLRASLLAAACVPSVAASAAAAQAPTPIVSGAPIERRIAPGQTHRFTIYLGKGESAEIIVLQAGVDVAVEVRDPARRLLDTVDSPNGRQGPEPVTIFAASTGTYTIDVRPLGGNEPEGMVRISLETRRSQSATSALLQQRRARRQEATNWFRPRSAPLPPVPHLNGAQLPAFDAMAAQARLIGLGEASHGSRELNDVRLSLVKRLVAQHGYRLVALEDSALRWRELAGYLSGESAAPPEGAQLEWGWIGRRARNELLLWVRQWNLDHSEDQVVIVGVDGDAAGRERLAALIGDAYGPAAAERWTRPAAELRDAAEQASVFGDSGISSATRQAVLELAILIQQDLPLLEARFGVARAAQALADSRALAQFADYNSGGGLVSHSRDRYMAVNTLAALADGKQRKGIYWGHNAHVSAAATRWGPTGALLREALGCGYQALGTTFGRGAFVAQVPNDAQHRLAVSALGEPVEESVEATLAGTGKGERFVWWGCGRQSADLPEWLQEPRRMRWIGGVYDPAAPPTGSYSQYRVTQAFDGIIYFPSVRAEDTGPPLPRVPPRQRPNEAR